MALMDKLELAAESNLDIGEEIDADPAPDERPKRRPARKPRTVAAKAPATRAKPAAQLAKQVGNDIASMLSMTSVVWGIRDQCCAPVLDQQAKPIGDALAAILARNPELLAKFANAETGVLVMQCLALGQALLPLGQAVFRNHVVKAGDPDGPNADVTDLDSFPAFSGLHRGHPA
jgi:hypothetical protein